LPKTRSWFALGAPFELLSPLSALRIVVLLSALTWPAVVAAATFEGAGRAPPSVLVAGGLAAAAWVALMRIGRVGTAVSTTTAAAGLAGAAAVSLTAGRSWIAVAYLLLVVAWCAFVALYSSLRAVGVTVFALASLGGVIAARHVPIPAAAGIGFLVAVSVLSVTTPLVVASRAARRRGRVDPDTGLPNVHGLALRPAAGQIGAHWYVAVLSLSGLPEVREAIGYRAATELLRRVVEDLGQVVPAGTVIGRVGGDDLAVVGSAAPSGIRSDDQECAETLVRRLVGALSAGRYLIGELETTVTASAGVALAPWHGEELADLLRRATHAARRAQMAGAVARVWDGERDAFSADDLELLGDLRVAGERGQLMVVYQPQLRGDGRVVSVEALLRWDHPKRGAVSPERFVALAERTGVVNRLTDWSLDQALDAQVRWRLDGLRLPVSVNLSAKELSRSDLPERVLTRLDQRSLPPELLCLEITETAAASVELQEILAVLEPLRCEGVRISIDDFGTGYTSLEVLPALPLDEIKVDLGFVKRSGHSPRDDAIVRSVCDLARRLELVSVAEGVEDAACAARMTSYGYDLLQGYHFSRPLPEADLLDYLRSRSVDGGAARAVPS